MTEVNCETTYIDTETTQLEGRIGITQYAEIPDIQNFDNHRYFLSIRPNTTTLLKSQPF